MKKLFTQSKSSLIAGFVGLYLISTGLSLALFSFIGGDSAFFGGSLDDRRAQIAAGAPKTQECPINGEKFTKAEESIWQERRPIVAMIENHVDSRPQSGLSEADLVYEAVAEGGITRFASVFYCDTADKDTRIGPIRSARIYYINWAREYGDFPLYLHVGGANNICGSCPGGVKPKGQVDPRVLALEELINLDWRHAKGNALDAGTNVGFPAVWRDYERIPGAATEHTFMGSTDALYEIGAERGFGFKHQGDSWNENFTSWKFKDGDPSDSPEADEISFEFWSNKPNYDVSWEYDSETNSYLRSHGNIPHKDMDTDEQLTAKNVLIQFVEEIGPVDDEFHMYYEVVGEGDIILFQNGEVIEGTWEKASQSGRTIFYDEGGDEIEFVRGVIWIEALPAGNTVNY